MRLLRNVIKASEYVTVKNKKTIPHNDFHSEKDCDKSPKDNNSQNDQRIVVKEAFEKAKQIMQAAQTYSLNKVKESNENINEESTQLLRKSREEGYAKGFSEGKEKGNQIGYKEGYEDGFNKAQEENNQVLQELSDMLKTVENMKAQVIENYKEDIKKLSIDIAEKVIKRELSVDEKAMQSIILNSMDSYKNEEWIRIIVSKNTKSGLINSDKSIAHELKDASDNIKIEVSPDMNDGDCKIDMPERMIDVGVDTQLSNIKRELQL